MLDRPMGDPELHFWLTRSVARTMGISLSEAMAAGQLTAQDYAQMVTSCRGCPLVATCQHWLGAQTGGARSAPEGCRNASTLEKLARRH
ncbi:DUF6455 family protein [Marivita sp. GX14005]|uniref:DUF6455 family protein n=1 Tax=Marivita sp. GX14005 TaxID=2942276 RepID=UPI002019BF40|nr:DUF6455 family protein [Marivita sp. GX14005]MCL3881721.1 DUF6455 family protein [Marivita sp. GX14005]